MTIDNKPLPRYKLPHDPDRYRYSTQLLIAAGIVWLLGSETLAAILLVVSIIRFVNDRADMKQHERLYNSIKNRHLDAEKRNPNGLS